jgi:asparagine synthase (glutamine-hydrolysing)
MCGIAGIFSKNKGQQFLVNEAKKMADSMAHRGPDESGIWYESDYSCVLSHRRLSILDLSKNGSQPMISKSNRFVICYNGEIYNTKELLKNYSSANLVIKGHSDTEIILELFEQYGLDTIIPKLIGMFAFSLFDRKYKKIFLCRDRLGIKPLYWGLFQNELIFSSELKAFNHKKSFIKELNRDSISNFLRHGYIPSPNTIYKNISKLEPGKLLEIDMKEFVPSINSYWYLPNIIKKRSLKNKYNDKELINSLDNLLNDSISRRMVADVPVGAFLSGGVDSTTVSAIMQNNSKKKIKTFSIGFEEPSYDEAHFAKKIAQKLQTDHHELYLTSKEAQKFIPDIPKYFDEPFADSSQIPTYLISKMASKSVKVALSGDGGDELFMGYNRYQVANNLNFIGNLPGFFKKFILQIIKLGSIHQWNIISKVFSNRFVPSQLGDKLYKLAKILKDDDSDFYRLLISSFDYPDKFLVSGKEKKGLVWKNNFDNFLSCYVEKLKLLDTMTYLPDDILTKVDRASMAVSLEVRVPILDHRIVEFSWTLPKEIQLKKNQSKWILRQVLKKYMPEKLFNRPKMGFGIPLDSWLRKDLKNWASHLLSDEVFNKYELLKKDDIQLMWGQHQRNEKNWQYPIWNVLMLHSWAEEYL